MRFTDIILRKRDGFPLSEAEIRVFVEGSTTGAIPDYQVSALLMAIYLRGMTDEETAGLTAAMVESGQQLDLSALPGPTIDKHSTGGVGDKTSLIVVPILAAAGAFVGKMSGRGLGHTGGTLDKLEAIPGFRVNLTADEMITQVATVGACLTGQTEQIAPADRKLYALRDVTGTVESLPLIASSILSKKLAGGAKNLLFDVKVGNGALLKTETEARQLATALVDGAKRNGRNAIAVLSDMNQPLGRAVGNALEIEEVKNLLQSQTTDCGLTRSCTSATEAHDSRGQFPPSSYQVNCEVNHQDDRLRELCVFLANEGLRLVGLPANAEEILDSGKALAKFEEIVVAQGGDLQKIKLGSEPAHRVTASRGGFISTINTAELGWVVVALGGGRARKEDAIDPNVGLIVHRRIGDRVNVGDPLVDIYALTQTDAKTVVERVQAAFTISLEPVPALPLIYDVIKS